MTQPLTLRFLGTGNAAATELGNSAAVLESADKPLLLIDCGPDVLPAWLHHYPDSLPEALFITHTHMDHVGGLEALFYRAWLDGQRRSPIKLYAPVHLLHLLHERVVCNQGTLAEGGVNFWDAFQLIPVKDGFWHAGRYFEVFPVRHHEPMTAFGLALPGMFVYTGDTRPIPEVLGRYATRGETVFHDCALHGNPSHTGLDDLTREYSEAQRRQMVLYHYESADAGDALREAGYLVASPGSTSPLSHGARADATSPKTKLHAVEGMA